MQAKIFPITLLITQIKSIYRCRVKLTVLSDGAWFQHSNKPANFHLRVQCVMSSEWDTPPPLHHTPSLPPPVRPPSTSLCSRRHDIYHFVPLQSLSVDWPAPLLVLLSASINILLSITKWGKHSLVGTYSEMDSCGWRYIRFQLFFFFFFFKLSRSLTYRSYSILFLFCLVNIVKVWKAWKTTDLSNPDMFHLRGIHQDALKLFSSHLEFIFGPQCFPQMVSVCSETNCSSLSFCQTITLCQSLRIRTSFHPSPRQPLSPSVSRSPSSRNKVPEHQQRMAVSCTHHQSHE